MPARKRCGVAHEHCAPARIEHAARGHVAVPDRQVHPEGLIAVQERAHRLWARGHPRMGPDHAQPRLQREELHDGELIRVGVEVDALAQHDLGEALDHGRARLPSEEVELADALVHLQRQARLEIGNHRRILPPVADVLACAIGAQDRHDALGVLLVELDGSVIGRARDERAPNAGLLEESRGCGPRDTRSSRARCSGCACRRSGGPPSARAGRAPVVSSAAAKARMERRTIRGRIAFWRDTIPRVLLIHRA